MTMTVSAPRPAESGHWYTRDGEPMYTVEAKDGYQRPTTLRDARKLDLVPSVTTIIRCASSPGLEQWKQQQILMAALTMPPRLPDEKESDYISRIVNDAKQEGIKAAEEGSDIHASIQSFYEGKSYRQDHEPFVNGCHQELFKLFGKKSWIAEKSFSHPSGFGGKVDLHAYNIVLDVKTKEFDHPDAVKGYDEHLMQLAAYRLGLEMPAARCLNIFVSRSKPGMVKVIEWSEEDIQRGLVMFQSLLNYWQAKNAHT